MEHSFSTSLFRQLLLQKKESDAFSLSVPTHNLLSRIEAALLVKHKNKYLFCKEPSPLAAINNTSSSYAVWAVLPMDSLSPLKLRRQITRVWLGLAACYGSIFLQRYARQLWNLVRLFISPHSAVEFILNHFKVIITYFKKL